METQQKENKVGFVFALVGSVGGLFLFALILWLTYLPTHIEEVGAQTRLELEAKLVETLSEDQEKAITYGVIDKDNGIYRIPIEKSMELTLKSYQGK